MNKTIFMLSLAMFLIGCGKDISRAVANSFTLESAAPWRITRDQFGVEDLPLAEDRDAICQRDFGAKYVNGLFTEYEGLAERLSSHLLIFAESPSPRRPSTGDYFNSSTASIWCIRK